MLSFVFINIYIFNYILILSNKDVIQAVYLLQDIMDLLQLVSHIK